MCCTIADPLSLSIGIRWYTGLKQLKEADAVLYCTRSCDHPSSVPKLTSSSRGIENSHDDNTSQKNKYRYVTIIESPCLNSKLGLLGTWVLTSVHNRGNNSSVRIMVNLAMLAVLTLQTIACVDSFQPVKTSILGGYVRKLSVA